MTCFFGRLSSELESCRSTVDAMASARSSVDTFGEALGLGRVTSAPGNLIQGDTTSDAAREVVEGGANEGGKETQMMRIDTLSFDFLPIAIWHSLCGRSLRSCAVADGSAPSSSRWMISTHSCGDTTSHSPSVASSMNSSSGLSAYSLISGSGISRFLSRLSPRERETASCALTRHVPKKTTAPPACSTRARSSAREGLWMLESSKATRLRLRIPCESPTLATHSLAPRMSATMAVVPDSSPQRSAWALMSWSVLTKASKSARVGDSAAASGCSRKARCRWMRAMREAMAPPCPSKMANQDCGGGRGGFGLLLVFV